MNVGVVGANGFIGSNLCKVNLELGNRVFAICNKKTENVPLSCTVTSIESANKLFFDQLFISIGGHASSHSEFIIQYEFLYKIIQSLKFKRIIFISSIAVYGDHLTPISVNSCYRNPALYGLAKLAQEFLIRSCEDYIIIRPTYVYGIGMRDNSLIPIWIKKALREKKITIFGNGKRMQDYLHIDDLMSLSVSAANQGGNNTVIAASGVSYSNTILAEKISKFTRGIEIKYSGEDVSSSFEFDVTYSFDLYGWKSKVDIDLGIMNYIKHEISNL